ncbi:MAG: HNH endonuclease signature motif containing protein, partial [Ilumatobacteraceae bacterium]
HHINYWNSGGPTDMANLVPLCASHHRCAHEGGWKLLLDSQSRRLTVRQPGSQLVRSALPDTARMRR